jgi:hypothetical protein
MSMMRYPRVNLGHPSNEKLQFSFVKEFNQVLRYDFVEAVHEGLRLFSDSCLSTVFHNRFDILLLVIFGDGYISSARLQLDFHNLAKAVFRRSERFVQDIGDVIFSESNG